MKTKQPACREGMIPLTDEQKAMAQAGHQAFSVRFEDPSELDLSAEERRQMIEERQRWDREAHLLSSKNTLTCRERTPDMVRDGIFYVDPGFREDNSPAKTSVVSGCGSSRSTPAGVC